MLTVFGSYPLNINYVYKLFMFTNYLCMQIICIIVLQRLFEKVIPTRLSSWSSVKFGSLTVWLYWLQSELNSDSVSWFVLIISGDFYKVKKRLSSRWKDSFHLSNFSSRISNPASQIPVMIPTAAKPTMHGRARDEWPRTSHLLEHRAPINPRIETRTPNAVKQRGTITSTFVASFTFLLDQ